MNFKFLSGFFGRFIRGNVYEETAPVTTPIGRNRATIGNWDPFQPNTQDRFLLNFPGEIGILNHYVKSVSNIRHNIENGLSTWNDITITFYDPIDPNIVHILHNIVNNEHDFDDPIIIDRLDPTGVVVRRIRVFGGVSSFSFGEMSYNISDPSELSLTLRVNHVSLDF